MMAQVDMIPRSPGLLLMLGALVAWYIASRAAVDAVASGAGNSIPRRAMAYWLPVAILALLATLARKPELAIGAIFGTCVAALSLVLGLASLSIRTHVRPVSEWRGPWSMVAPLGIILLLAGFAGYFDWFRAAVLPLYGLVALYVWIEQPAIASGMRQRLGPWQLGQLALAVCLAGVGGWMAIESSDALAQSLQFFTGAFVGSAMLAPALMLPVIGNCSELAFRGQHERAVSSLVLMVLLNLCLLLPLVIVLGLVLNATTTTTSLPALEALRHAEPLRFPLATWRVDTIFLIILGFMLIPLAAGRWMIGRAEAVGLVFAYGVYLALLARHAVS